MRDNERRQLAAEVRGTVPGAPGVYAFFDGGGQLMYVGKSVSLRQRVGSYFGRDPRNAEPHLGRLVSGARSFAWWQTRSELLALLLEDAMIKEHRPPQNTRLKETAENRYLELTGDDFPACLIVEYVPSFGTREVFGPLKDKYFAAVLRDILHETLCIRTCGDPQPVRRCLEHDIGRCAGPCRGALEPDRYRELVAMARDFLRGDAGAVQDRLVSARDHAAAAKRYEEAARLRDALDTCRRFEAHERFARRFTEGDCRVCCAEDDIEYLFARGALVEPRIIVTARGQGGRRIVSSQASLDPEAAGHQAVAALHRTPSADRRPLADRTRIVCNWVRSRGGGRIWFGDEEGQVPESNSEPADSRSPREADGAVPQ